MKSYIKNVPVPIGGLALGLASLGILFSSNPTIYWICGCAATLCLLLLGGRILTDMDGIRADLKNPVVASVCVAGFMATMQLSTYLTPFAYPVAFGLWCAAIVGHVCMMVYFTKVFVFQRSLSVFTPTAFVCYVGIIVASLTSPTFGMQQLGYAIFWIGFAFYMTLLVIVTLRYIKIPMPEAARPTFCIYTAPMSLSLAGYLACAAHISAPLLITMTALAQLFLIVVLVRLPTFLKLPFYPSYAAMTFPFVISASALGKSLAYLTSIGMNVPSVLTGITFIEAGIAACMVVYVALRYTLFLHAAWNPQKNSITPTCKML